MEVNCDNCVSFNLEHFQVGFVSSCFQLSFGFSSKGIGVQKEVESSIYKRHPGTKSFKVERMDVWWNYSLHLSEFPVGNWGFRYQNQFHLELFPKDCSTHHSSTLPTTFRPKTRGEVRETNKSSNVFFLSENDTLQRFVKAWHETVKTIRTARSGLERVFQVGWRMLMGWIGWCCHGGCFVT